MNHLRKRRWITFENYSKNISNYQNEREKLEKNMQIFKKKYN